MMCPRERMTRRQFLQAALKGGVLALFGATLYPVLRYLTPPPEKGDSVTDAVAAKVGELSANQGKVFRFGNRPAILVTTPYGDLRAFSAVCTPLNCTVQYAEQARGIMWACHNGKFDLAGQVISGPPPRPLEAYQVNVRGDDIVVSKTS